MDTVNPYIYYVAQIIGNMRIVIGCGAALSFFASLGLLMSTVNLEKVIEYNQIFKNENLNIDAIIQENDTKFKRIFKYNILGITLVIIALLIPDVATAYNMLINL